MFVKIGKLSAGQVGVGDSCDGKYLSCQCDPKLVSCASTKPDREQAAAANTKAAAVMANIYILPPIVLILVRYRETAAEENIPAVPVRQA